MLSRTPSDRQEARHAARSRARITLNGPESRTRSPRSEGKVDLDLDDASLVEMPVFKELDRFLGAARGGGLFEDGDVHGTIYNRTLFVEQMTLNGRLIQVHATGTITFDGGLNLEVLVNTNQVIPQSGLALVNIIPGLGQALGRGEEAFCESPASSRTACSSSGSRARSATPTSSSIPASPWATLPSASSPPSSRSRPEQADRSN